MANFGVQTVMAIAAALMLSSCGGGDEGGGGGSQPPSGTPPANGTSTPVPAAFVETDSSALPAPPSADPSAKKPNIVMIIADDLRPELGAYGSPVAKTPNMDAIAASGALFENAFISQAACAPSRAAIMTGLRPDTTGITGGTDTLAAKGPNLTTLGDVFKAADYTMFRIGKIYHDVGDDLDSFTYVPSAPIEFAPEDYAKVSMIRMPNRESTADYQNAQTAAASIRNLAKGTKPFFWAVGILRPHLPFIAPIDDWNRYSGMSFPAPRNASGQVGAFSWSLSNSEIFAFDDLRPYRPTMPAQKAAELTWAYLAAVSSVDHNVGIIMQAIKESGIENDTIVVLLGDHGFKLGDHGNYWAKQSNADIDIRIPLIISAPGRVAPGTRVSGLVEGVDLFPTLTDMAGISNPVAVEGASFRRLLSAPARAWKTAAFAQYPRYSYEMGGRADMTGYTVRTANYRYTAWIRQSDRALIGQELYDLVNDRQESTNVASNSNYRAVLTTLEQMRLAGWRPVRDKLPS